MPALRSLTCSQAHGSWTRLPCPYVGQLLRSSQGGRRASPCSGSRVVKGAEAVGWSLPVRNDAQTSGCRCGRPDGSFCSSGARREPAARKWGREHLSWHRIGFFSTFDKRPRFERVPWSLSFWSGRGGGHLAAEPRGCPAQPWGSAAPTHPHGPRRHQAWRVGPQSRETKASDLGVLPDTLPSGRGVLCSPRSAG